LRKPLINRWDDATRLLAAVNKYIKPMHNVSYLVIVLL